MRKSCFFLYLGLFWLYSDCSEAAFQFTNRKLGAPLEIDYRISLLDIGVGVAQAEGDLGGGQYRLTIKARATPPCETTALATRSVPPATTVPKPNAGSR